MTDIIAVIVVIVFGILVLGSGLFTLDFLGAVGRKALKFVEEDKKERAKERPGPRHAPSAAKPIREPGPSLTVRMTAGILRWSISRGRITREDAIKSLMKPSSGVTGMALTRREAEAALGVTAQPVASNESSPDDADQVS